MGKHETGSTQRIALLSERSSEPRPQVPRAENFVKFGHVILADRLYKSLAVAEMGDRLATVDMGRKVGGGCCAPLRGGELGLHPT